jgi:hypothetical protein
MKLRTLTAVVFINLALILVIGPAAASASGWSLVPLALPTGASGGFLGGVDCLEAASCVAVGAYYTGIDESQLKPMVATETGGSWGPATPISEALGAAPAQLVGVDCGAPGDCVAVGYEAEGEPVRGTKRPIATIETDGVWGPATRVVPPGGSLHAILTAVSCPGASSCEAVGGDGSGPFAVGETDGAWGTAVQIPPTSAGTGSPISDTIKFNDVSCPAVGDCVGAGEWWTSGGEEEPWAASQAAGSWSGAGAVAPAAASARSSLEGVSCAKIGSCVAVGDDGTVPFATTYAAGSWGPASSIAPPDGAPSAGLAGVSCPGTDSCVAAGSYYPTGYQLEGRPMVAVDSGGVWGPAEPLTPPSGATYAWLLDVGCPPTGPCLAAGIWSDASGGELPLVYSGEAPSPGAPSDPGGPGGPGTGSSTVGVVPIATPSGGGGAISRCAVVIKTTTASVTKAAVARIRLADVGGGPCEGTVSLSTSPAVKGKGSRRGTKKHGKTIGQASVRLAPGATAAVRVHLRSAGKAALRKAHGTLKASVTVDAGGTRAVKTIRLRRAKGKGDRGTR